MPNAAQIASILQGVATLEDLATAKGSFWAKLRQTFKKFPAAREAVALFHFISDPDVNFGLKGAAILALVYFISPVDLVPDAIPLAGLVDDGMVLMAAVTSLAAVLAPYRKRAEESLADGPAPEPEVVIPVEVQTRN
ncbi:MAG: DUF1232 domain-containing protein [Planctomycetes bacterium]|jgi:uncharacterized membrane protein YkvA (DUF1232 family)|nr:DUF1232 domain-containing protein [Planctomycetota bacterium]MCL4730015.1 DUF1232 domain-containing protein [Planctomycetota bacterium]